jgi:hypothetical protein
MLSGHCRMTHAAALPPQQLLARMTTGSSRAEAAAEALESLATRAEDARLAMLQGVGVVGPVLQVGPHSRLTAVMQLPSPYRGCVTHVWCCGWAWQRSACGSAS